MITPWCDYQQAPLLKDLGLGLGLSWAANHGCPSFLVVLTSELAIALKTVCL